MRVIAVDPGTRESAWVAYSDGRIVAHAIEPNEEIERRFGRDDWSKDGFGAGPFDDRPIVVVFEQIESMGMAVGREVFETVFWTGRLFHAAMRICREPTRLTRRTVKVHLCNSSRAQDTNIRVALIDRFGGPDVAVGKKRSPGPLYGIVKHEWSALAIAITWWDLHAQQPAERQVAL